MQSLTVNIKDDTLTEKVLWMLKHFEKDGLEISSKEDIEDLKMLKTTRNDGSSSSSLCKAKPNFSCASLEVGSMAC